MKIAIFSDVHANLTALEAVLEDIKEKKADLTICAGDLVGYAPFPNEVIELIRDQNIPCVMGNYDDGIGNFRIICGCDYKDEAARQLGEKSITWTLAHVNDENKAFLRSLPHEIRLETNDYRVLIVHGSPNRLNEYLREDTADEYLEGLIKENGVDILVCAHTHIPYHKILPQGHVINTGSIGKPKHGSPRAVYALLNIQTGISVDFIEVSYDVEKTARAIEISGLPPEFAAMLRTGQG